MLKRVALVLVVLLGAGLLLRRLGPRSRALYVGGPILTMDAQDHVVEALAIEGDRIVAVSSASELRPWAEQHGARVVDLAGRVLLPGFVDAHGHFPGAGLDAIAADLNAPQFADPAHSDGVDEPPSSDS